MGLSTGGLPVVYPSRNLGVDSTFRSYSQSLVCSENYRPQSAAVVCRTPGAEGAAGFPPCEVSACRNDFKTLQGGLS